jgi:CHAD domain-containing protein
VNQTRPALDRFFAPSDTAPALGHVLLDALEQRWRTYRKELRRSRRTFSEEAIHDVRVATRRLISTLMIIQLLIPDERVERMRRRLKRLFDACSPLRDTQVQLLALEPQVERYPELETLVTILKVRERNLIRAIGKKARRVATARWSRTVGWMKQALREQFSHPLMHEAARAVVLGAAARAFGTAVFFKERVVAARPKTIHRARIAFKKFRYTMEALAPLLPGLDKEQLKAMDTYQTRMGVIQDAEVLSGMVQRFAGSRTAASRRKLAAFQRELRKHKRTLIDAYINASDEIYSFWHQPSFVPDVNDQQ